ncbi:MAG: tetratricopeptide repeat protein [Planctomycetota bacterium]|nr:tetratricopeptide repeat protein [Planctomycetota bacterium]
MNGRFSRLEFGSREEPPSEAPLHTTDKSQEGTLTRSADHFLAQATRANRRGEFESALQLYTRALREDRSRIVAWVGQVQMLVELGEYGEARLWSDKALEAFRSNGDLLAAKAQACLRVGDTRAAQICSDASVQAAGSGPFRWASRGETLLAQGQPRARDCFDKCIAEPAADWFDRIVIARIYLYHHKPAAALEFASHAVGLAPAEPYAWTVRAKCLFDLGETGKAEECCRRALELDPRLLVAQNLHKTVVGTSPAGVFNRLKGWLRR